MYVDLLKDELNGELHTLLRLVTNADPEYVMVLPPEHKKAVQRFMDMMGEALKRAERLGGWAARGGGNRHGSDPQWLNEFTWNLAGDK